MRRGPERIVSSLLSIALSFGVVFNSVNADELAWNDKTPENSKNDTIHSDNIYYFDPVDYTVNTGKDNGFSGSNQINTNDPHNGWQLGRFYVKGFTDILTESGEIIILKNVGDEISFGYELFEDIDCLNGDSTLSINDDEDTSDTEFQTGTMDFGRGALLVKETDYQGITETNKYIDFLEGCSVGAETDFLLFEEGDYRLALDYEIKDGRSFFGHETIFGSTILPTYTKRLKKHNLVL